MRLRRPGRGGRFVVGVVRRLENAMLTLLACVLGGWLAWGLAALTVSVWPDPVIFPAVALGMALVAALGR